MGHNSYGSGRGRATLEGMSEPQQPSVPPHGQPTPQQPIGMPDAPQPSGIPAAAPTPQQPAGMPQGQPPQQGGAYGQSAAAYTPQPFGQPTYGQAPGAQPGAPSPAQPQNGYGYPGQAFAPAAPRAIGSLGRVAFILALIAFGISMLSVLAYPVLFRLVGYSASSLFAVSNGAIGFVGFAVAAAALITGLVAIRRDGPKVLAGIAIGIAAGQVAGAVLSWVTNLFSFLY